MYNPLTNKGIGSNLRCGLGMNGQTLNPGVFAYNLIMQRNDGSPEVRFGDITLIR